MAVRIRVLLISAWSIGCLSYGTEHKGSPSFQKERCPALIEAAKEGERNFCFLIKILSPEQRYTGIN
jgi:hypothetical protein